jgi:AcrR family transcriptional regulator
MAVRLRRTEQVERNRDLVLDAARRVFLEKGYAGASLDAIAEEAGFSKGVVYSQFDSKADLFLALLERRVTERSEENERLAGTMSGPEGVTALVQLGERAFEAEPEWALLVVEFRLQAARNPELNRRYAAVHARTVDRFARVLERMLGPRPAGAAPAAVDVAEVLLALGVGLHLERAVNPAAVRVAVVEQIMAAALAGAQPTRARQPGRKVR